MVKLRADEHRYLVSAEEQSEALLKQIPGCRFVAGQQAFQLPRQPGAVIALDRIFGPDGWECPSDLAQEVSETRSRQTAPAQHEATVALVGNELSVECAFIDKELVKLVPGYRWSAPQRRWFLPASPMALDLLREHFDGQLSVDDAATAYLDLRRRDEAAAIKRAKALPSRPIAATEPPQAPEVGMASAAVSADAVEGTPAEAALNRRLDRLADAVEELVAILRANAGALSVAGAPQVVETAAADGAQEPEFDWRELLGKLETEAAEVRDHANRLAQTAAPDHEASYRAVAGLALMRLGQYPEALGALRRGLERPGSIEDDLSREATLAYSAAVLALVTSECGPSSPLTSEQQFRDRLLEELVEDAGFEAEKLGSPAARARLDYFVNDPVLRRIAPVLSDYCRIAHLLGVARGGQWMAATRITDILQEQSLGDESFALALVLLANALYDGASLNDWDKAWPREDVQDSLQDLSWLVAHAETRLRRQGVDGSIAEAAALACLACIAGGPIEWASTNQRKNLVHLVSLRHAPRRAYAEFLAAYQPAASGQKSTLSLFPGWARVLAERRISKSAPYLMDVAANDHGGAGSLTWAVAESVYLQALELWGIDDAQTQVIDLLDLLEAGKRPDNYLNELGRLVETPATELKWTALVNREQRKTLYRRALEVSIKQGHDRDSIEAFDRIVRELRAEGDAGRDELLSLALRLSTGMRALRGPALEVLLGMQLEAGEPFEDTAVQLLRLGTQYQDGEFELSGLAQMFPQFREFLRGEMARLEAATPTPLPDEFPGRRVLLVGGHEWLRQHVKPVLEDRWKLEVVWLTPDEAERGPQGPGVAQRADLVVINTACIGHAASGRILAAAKAANTPFVAHGCRGIGALLAFIQQTLAAGETRAA